MTFQEFNQLTPIQQIRLLADSILANDAPPGSIPPPPPPVQTVLSRPVSGKRLVPLASVVAAALPCKPVAPLNPYRCELNVRIDGGDATTVVGLFGDANAQAASPYLRIKNGETVTVNMTGEVFCTLISGTAATVYAWEIITGPAQP